MQKDFWLERWRLQEIGFHQPEFNPYLLQYWQELRLTGQGEVFVPLCGKSRDMLWLHEQGHGVLGVELSELAAQSFFAENLCTVQPRREGKLISRQAGQLRILCGDFFDLGRDDLMRVRAVYDRASLIALPAEMRAAYARHMAEILPPATQILLIAFDYPQHEMSGPPFAVTASEVASLYGDYAEIRQLAQFDVLAQHFQQRGLSRLQENVFLLTMR